MKTKNNSIEASQKIWRIMGLLVTFLIFFFTTALAQNETDNIDVTIGSKERVAIIDTIITKFNKLYVFPDIAKKYETHLRNRLESKAYDDISTLSKFTAQLTKDMLSVYNDGHLAILVYNKRRDEGHDEKSNKEWWNNYVKDAEYNNYGYHKLERLPGNIGYLDLRFLERPVICYETTVAAMQFLSNSDAIIIDLRKNPGGRTAMVQLIMSYFFEDHRTHYSTEIDRLKGITRQWWTLAEVPGKRMPEVPLYILTSFDTGSGAEDLAYSLKHTRRATLIGDTTAGAAHKTHIHSIPELGISIALPDGHSISPITGKDWEDTGVIPHILVSPDKALDVAYAIALDSLLITETDEYIRFKLEWVKKEIDIQVTPIILDKKIMKQYVGQYGVRNITLIEGVLYYMREGRSKYIMIPLGTDLFMLDGVDYFRIQFKKDKDGNVIKLVGLYDDGTSSVSNITE